MLVLAATLVTLVLLWWWGTSAAQSPAGVARLSQAPADDAHLPRSPKRHASPSPPDTAANASETASDLAAQPEEELQPHVVILRDDTDYQRLRDWAAANGFRLAGEIPRLHALRLLLTDAQYERLVRDSGVEATEEADTLVHLPDRSEKYPAWTGDAGPAFGDSYRRYLGVDTSDPNRGRGVTIALLDTPVFRHHDLESAAIANLSVSAPPDNADSNAASHGTAVASILVGANGISNASLLAYGIINPATGSAAAFDLAAAIVDAVDQGADLISLSLGSYDDSTVLHDAVNYALANQVLLVAAAGNHGVEEICYPAAYDGVLSVGAIDADGNVSGFSNYGDGLDLVAPGVGLQVAGLDDEYGLFSGTSAAVPCVTAILANYLAEYPNSSPADAYAKLLQSCTDTEAPGYDPASGFGVIDAERLSTTDDSAVLDAAAAGITFDATTGALTVTAQNTGTQSIDHLELTTHINGVELTNIFNEVSPGAIVSATGELPTELLERADTLTVKTAVSTPNADDERPRNQTHRQTFDLNPDEDL